MRNINREHKRFKSMKRKSIRNFKRRLILLKVQELIQQKIDESWKKF